VVDNLGRRVAKAISKPFVEANKNLLVELHGEVFGSKLCRTCRNEQILAYIELSRLITPKKNEVKENKNTASIQSSQALK